MFVDSTWQSPFVAMNIEYKDSVYSIVPREGDMYLFLNDGVANKKYRYELFPILLEQTLGIDSITFCSLKERLHSYQKQFLHKCRNRLLGLTAY